jgi:hypothetical protein
MNKNRLSTSRRLTIFAALLLIFVVLPGLSWVYLQGGLNWRKAAQAELSKYGKIRAAYTIWPEGDKQDELKEKVTVVHVFGSNPDLTPANKHIMDTGEELFQQFGQSMYFRMAMVADGGTTEFRSYRQTRPSSDYATWVWTGGIGSWTTIMKNGFESYCVKNRIKPYPHYYALSDTSGMIRRFYNAMDKQEVGRMVEHIALLLPQD